MKKFTFLSLFLFASIALKGDENSLDQLFSSLKKAQEIDDRQKDQLPTIYNADMIIGYLNMPSARVNPSGTSFLGGNYVPPYHAFGANLQVYKPIELSVNYRIFSNLPEENFGAQGFGDDADRTANVKFSFSPGNYFSFLLPDVAVGFNDFYGSRRFYSLYTVATLPIADWNFETTLGWGNGRIDGFFGGVAFTPWRFSDTFLLKDLTFFAEYDANDYKNNDDEHPDGREVKSRVNIGFSLDLVNAVQLKVSSLRGNNWSASGGIYYNLGQSKGLVPKVKNPPLYSAPLNHEPLGPLRNEEEIAYELALALGEQGLNVARIYLEYDEQDRKILWIRLINLRYFMSRDARERIFSVLAALVPDNIYKTTVALEEGSLIVQTYTCLTRDLLKYSKGEVSESEMKILAPPEEFDVEPNEYDSALLFKRDKTLWSMLVRPRMLSFFGSTNGKYKYALGLIGGPQGYILDTLYYKTQLAYNILASNADVGDIDVYNPSQLINVRSDSVNYYKSNSVTLEQAYLQKGWNFGKGWYYRLAGGYFEAAYAGLSTEALYYPIESNWAIGLSAASVMKREYEGLGFQYKVRKLDGTTPTYVPFVGLQYFLDLYYDIKPINLDIKLSIGQFLARDRGAKAVLTRYFDSGFTFSFWYALTNANDKINHKVYHDKGIAFSMPFDFFLHKSSRAKIGYGMSFWLRDSGATAATGKPLYPTINSARIYN
ncbi:MAG: YjbH domain-containing protein [Rhabdochlamydiaceae bacterium]|nr:YjbH domain-containing protein [Candidatus Amphrikana amoebophyrae]